MTIVLVEGKIDSGKTRYLSGLAADLKERGVSFGGILCPADYSEGAKNSYRAVDIATGESAPLVSMVPFDDGFTFGKFSFSRAGYRFASTVLHRSLSAAHLIIDEIGPVELSGMGYADDLRWLLSAYSGRLVLAVRDFLHDQVVEAFGLTRFPLEIVRIGE